MSVVLNTTMAAGSSIRNAVHASPEETVNSAVVVDAGKAGVKYVRNRVLVAFWSTVAVVSACGHILVNVGVKAGKILMHIKTEESRVFVAIIFPTDDATT